MYERFPRRYVDKFPASMQVTQGERDYTFPSEKSCITLPVKEAIRLM